MAYLLSVRCGVDKDRTFRIEPGENVIGRSPSSQIVMHDESVAWEHALIGVDDGRLTIRNLSAHGIRHRGRHLSGEAVRHANDEIELSDRCTVVLRQRAGAHAAASVPKPVIALVVSAVFVIVAGMAVMIMGQSEPARRPVSSAHWRQAYHRLDERMTTWSDQGIFPAKAHAAFNEAWRLEQVRNPIEAARKWQELRSWLLATPLPGAGPGGPTIAESAGATPKSLQVVMGWDLHARSTDFTWNSDTTYADALVWFVRTRAHVTSTQSDTP